MKKLFGMVLVLALMLTVLASAEVDTSAWVEMPVGETGCTILLPADMTEEAIEEGAEGWTDKDTPIYSGSCNDLAVTISKFEEEPTMEEVCSFIAEMGLFETVAINENGVLECLGGDDGVSMFAVGDQETGICCVALYPLEADPEAVEPDMSVGIEMADAVKASLKAAE